jgi:hypothetical protein
MYFFLLSIVFIQTVSKYEDETPAGTFRIHLLAMSEPDTDIQQLN